MLLSGTVFKFNPIDCGIRERIPYFCNRNITFHTVLKYQLFITLYKLKSKYCIQNKFRCIKFCDYLIILFSWLINFHDNKVRGNISIVVFGKCIAAMFLQQYHTATKWTMWYEGFIYTN